MENITETEVDFDVNAEVNRWAFPGKMWAFIGNREQEIQVNGLTKRELFSAMAMQGFISSIKEGYQTMHRDAAEQAVEFADALIAELNKPIK